MNAKSYYYVANWKMYFSYKQLMDWFEIHQHELSLLARKTSLIVCPSFEALSLVHRFSKESSFQLGAQHCSAHTLGAFTGQVSAQSLAEIGVSHCLVGHSEVRMAYGDSNEMLLRQLEQLIVHKIVPIFCIGESKEEAERARAEEVIVRQLQPLCEVGSRYEGRVFFIAYEPVWAIGSGASAHNEQIEYVFSVIQGQLAKLRNHNTYYLLYGGSVTSESVKNLKKMKDLDGFLIGKASTNFQELKKIVS